MADLGELKGRIPVSLLVEYLGGEIRGYTSSGWGRARCPFHSPDEDPSASVSPDDIFFQCRGCGTRGDIFDLIQAAGLAEDFPSAIAWIEDNLMERS